VREEIQPCRNILGNEYGMNVKASGYNMKSASWLVQECRVAEKVAAKAID
jgi:hypothetical protein